MKKCGKYHYFVEGECEEKLIKVLKEQRNLILSGRVDVLNVIQERFTDMLLRPISLDTTIILVFDTDTKETEILKENLTFLKRKHFKKVLCIIQVDNLEDEIVNSTCLKDAKELFKCEGLKEFKELFIKEKNLYRKLCEKKFSIKKIWISKPPKEYQFIENDGPKIMI